MVLGIKPSQLPTCKASVLFPVLSSLALTFNFYYSLCNIVTVVLIVMVLLYKTIAPHNSKVPRTFHHCFYDTYTLVFFPLLLHYISNIVL